MPLQQRCTVSTADRYSVPCSVYTCINTCSQFCCSNSTLHLPPPPRPPSSQAISTAAHRGVPLSTAHPTLQIIPYATHKTNTAHGNCMYTECLRVYSVSACIKGVCVYKGCLRVYRVSACIQGVCMYTGCLTSSEAWDCSFVCCHLSFIDTA